MPRGIETGQTLFQAQWRLVQRDDGHPPLVHAYPHPLIGMQMRLARHRRRQTHPQIVAPVFDIQNRLGHGLTPRKCLNKA